MIEVKKRQVSHYQIKFDGNMIILEVNGGLVTLHRAMNDRSLGSHDAALLFADDIDESITLLEAILHTLKEEKANGTI